MEKNLATFQVRENLRKKEGIKRRMLYILHKKEKMLKISFLPSF
jgi:hypothetical protein